MCSCSLVYFLEIWCSNNFVFFFVFFFCTVSKSMNAGGKWSLVFQSLCLHVCAADESLVVPT